MKSTHTNNHLGFSISTILLSAALIAGTSAAYAQGTGTSESATSTTIEEIVVTAARREESSQKTALALSVLSSDQLQESSIAQPEDLSKLMPGLKMTNATTTSIYVRGVGENSPQQNSQSAIAVSVDGVYVGRTSAVAGNFFDLQRIELLKGPQGTLYGRNASGGALNLITQKPTDELGGYATLEVGDYSLRRITAAVNLPATDTLAFRASVYGAERDGYLSDGTQDEDQRAARIHALWKPSDAVSLLWTVDGSQQKGLGDGTALYGVGDGRVGSSISPQAVATRAALGLAPLSPRFLDYKNWSTAGQLDWDLGFATLTVQPGYRHQEFSEGSPSVVTSGNSHQYTGETRLAHQGDKLKYVVGLYYFDETVHYDYHIYAFQGFALDSYQHIPVFDTQSKAVFGEATYSVTDRARIIAGIRRTHETRDFAMYTNWYGVGFFGVPSHDVVNSPITGLPTAHYAYNNIAERTFHNTSGKVGFEFDLSPASMVYLTGATGFKSGGFSISPPPTNTFNPEKLTAITLGIKNRFFDDSLQLNLEAFHWKYKNQQVAHLGTDINGATGFVTDNAGESTIKGANADIQWRATPKDTLGLNVEYLWAYYDTYDIVSPFPDTSGCVFTPTTVFGLPALNKDCSGLRLSFTPEVSATATYGHEFSLGGAGSLNFRSILQFATEQPTDVNQDPGTWAKEYLAADFNLTYRTASDKLSVMAYVRNAFDEEIANSVNLVFTPATIGLRPPRTYGLQVGMNF